MQFYDNFLSSALKQTPEEYYNQNRQETVNKLWQETDKLKTIFEQKAYPFENVYTEHQAWVTDVAENSITTQKDIADFIEVWYRDDDYPLNYKGQFYKIDNETYICYDKANPFSEFYNFKCVRANNELSFINTDNGKIEKFPCYIGTDIKSTQNAYSKTGVTQSVRIIAFTQANEFTMKLKENDRFIVSHNHAFKIEQIDNYVNAYGVGEPTYVKAYLSYEPILPEDNLELNIANYDNYKYMVKISDNKPIKASKGERGTIVGNVYLNGNMTELQTIWTTSDDTLVSITENGDYEVVGDNGRVTLTCAFKDNTEIYDTIEMVIENQHENEYNITLNVGDDVTIYNGDILNITVNCYENGIKQDNANFVVTSNWENNSKYLLIRNGNTISVENIEQSYKTLILTFSWQGIEKLVNIRLGGGF